MSESGYLPAAGERLGRLYAGLEARLAELGFECAACGQCCHFDEQEHILFASRLEIDHLLAAGGPPGPPARPGRCPYQVEERCRAGQRRPLGCRLYYCRTREPAQQIEELAELAHGRLKALHEEFGLRWDYRPFLTALPDSGPEAP